MNAENCNIDNQVPIWLMVSGAFGIFFCILKITFNVISMKK